MAGDNMLMLIMESASRNCLVRERESKNSWGPTISLGPGCSSLGGSSWGKEQWGIQMSAICTPVSWVFDTSWAERMPHLGKQALCSVYFLWLHSWADPTEVRLAALPALNLHPKGTVSLCWITGKPQGNWNKTKPSGTAYWPKKKVQNNWIMFSLGLQKDPSRQDPVNPLAALLHLTTASLKRFPYSFKACAFPMA